MPTVPDSGSDQDKPSSIPKEAENFISLLPISLTSQNFASTVGDGNVWLIEFYTPWYVAFMTGYERLLLSPLYKSHTFF